MFTDIHLFLGGTELEFSTPPQILYNYQVTDFTNPTVVKNGHSKTITVEGTPRNNQVFDHIFRNDREQGDFGFNPLKRAEFSLFVNGDIYEKGYAKLNSIKRSGNSISYEITLYSGIGSLLYSLSYLSDGSDKKMSLADLDYKSSGGTEPDLDFEICVDNVNAAWNRVGTTYKTGDSKWDIINFAITSEGIPDDFDADKVLINTYGNKSFSGAPAGYGPILGQVTHNNGYVLGDIGTEMTADNTFDLRSYLLRPLVNVKRVLQACQNPDVNGGHQLIFDSHFFHKDNPYYENAWMTLPMLRDLSLDSSTSASVVATISRTDKNHYPLSLTMPTGTTSSVIADVSVRYNPSSSTNATNLYGHREVTTTATSGFDNVKEFYSNQVLIIQMFGYDSSNNIITRSDAFMLGQSQFIADRTSTTTAWNSYTYKDGSRKRFVSGHFKKISNQWVFVDDNDNEIGIKFNANPIGVSRFEIYAENPSSYAAYYANGVNVSKQIFPDNTSCYYYTAATGTYNGNISLNSISSLDRVSGYHSLVLNSFEINTNNNNSLFSHTMIPKEKLLATSFTPAEFLLSYMKLFGLYLYQDPGEVSSNPSLYPNGVVHLVDRDTFYDEEIINLDGKIDRGKEMNITPAVAKTKYYKFDVEGIDSSANARYKDTYGYTYGRQLVDTTMDFDNETTDLYDGNIFRSGIMVQERNKYFNAPVNGVPAYAFDGIEFSFFKRSDDGYDASGNTYIKKSLDCVPINSDGLDYYDAFPKLQVRTDDWGSSDGSNVLLFYDGNVTPTDVNGNVVRYYLTDDQPEMLEVNDGNPCWIMTQMSINGTGGSIGMLQTYVPYFTRDIVRNGNIINSWNFGHPRETYIPDVYTTEGDSIYDKCWKNYIGDVYNVNTRIVSCNLKLYGRANPNWLRHYYWFDNALWRINKISDWNVLSPETTKVEFLKVLNVDDYKLNRITTIGSVTIVLSKNIIDKSGETITGKVYCQNASNTWRLDNTFSAVDELGNTTTYTTSSYISPTTGTGAETNISVRIPANTGVTERTITISGKDSQNNPFSTSIIQETDTTPIIYFINSSVTIDFIGGQLEFEYIMRHMDADTLSVTSDSIWAIPEINGNSVYVQVNQNIGTARQANITIGGYSEWGDAMSASTRIIQETSELAVSPSELIFDYWSTSAKTITITTEGPWSSHLSE